jgi:hypothetical protein
MKGREFRSGHGLMKVLWDLEICEESGKSKSASHGSNNQAFPEYQCAALLLNCCAGW